MDSRSIRNRSYGTDTSARLQVRTHHAADDTPLCHPGVTYFARRLPRSDGHDAPFQTCDNYVTATEFRDALADIKALRTDADSRGWTDEAARHERVAHALTGHLRRRYRRRRTSQLGTSKRVNPPP